MCKIKVQLMCKVSSWFILLFVSILQFGDFTFGGIWVEPNTWKMWAFVWKNYWKFKCLITYEYLWKCRFPVCSKFYLLCIIHNITIYMLWNIGISNNYPGCEFYLFYVYFYIYTYILLANMMQYIREFDLTILMIK